MRPSREPLSLDILGKAVGGGAGFGALPLGAPLLGASSLPVGHGPGFPPSPPQLCVCPFLATLLVLSPHFAPNRPFCFSVSGFPFASPSLRILQAFSGLRSRCPEELAFLLRFMYFLESITGSTGRASCSTCIPHPSSTGHAPFSSASKAR